MEKNHCPNCGAQISEKTITCGYCGFVIADKKALDFIDKSILKIENNILKLNKITSATFWDISLIFGLIYFGILTAFLIFPGIFEIILIFIFIKNKRIKSLLKDYKSTKRKHERDYDAFSLLYPKNKKLSELKINYKEKVLTNVKTLKTNFIKSSIAFIILFFATIIIPYSLITKDEIKEHFHNNTVLVLATTNIDTENNINYEIFTNNFYLNFEAQPPNNKRSKVIVTQRDIVLKINNVLFDSIDKINVEMYFSDTSGYKFDLPFNAEIELDKIKKSKDSSTLVTVIFNDTLLISQELALEYKSNFIEKKGIVANFKIH